MTVVRKFHPEVRLKALLEQPGGITVAAALEAAARNVDTVRRPCLEAVGEKVEEIRTLARIGDADSLARCYRLSNEVFGEAGFFGLDDLSNAAWSLCSVLGAGVTHGAAITVHADAMHLLRAPAGENPVIRKAVMDELRVLAERVIAEQKALSPD